MLDQRSKLCPGFFGARLALLALSVQLVLSFAHMHLPPPTTVLAEPQSIALSGTDSGSAANEDCAICATIAAFAAADLPPPIPFVRPVGQGEQILPWVAMASLTPDSFRYFNSRAPPNA